MVGNGLSHHRGSSIHLTRLVHSYHFPGSTSRWRRGLRVYIGCVHSSVNAAMPRIHSRGYRGTALGCFVSRKINQDRGVCMCVAIHISFEHATSAQCKEPILHMRPAS
ncbi:hypothetical protein V2G26_021171 [Clonostachys chloroleuca]